MLEKAQSNSDLLNWCKERYPEPEYDTARHSIENITHSFMNKFLRTLTGHSIATYPRKDDESFVRGINKDRSLFEYRYDPACISQQAANLLKERISGKTVVDLGCGIDGAGCYVAEACDADSYIGVEGNFPKCAEEILRRHKRNIPYIIVPTTIDDFLDNLQMEGKKLDVIIFSGFDQHSYTDDINLLRNVPQKICQSLSEDGIVILGGNTGYIQNEYQSEWDSLFEEIPTEGLSQHRFYFKKNGHQKTP